MLVSAAKYFEALSEIAHGALQQKERIATASKSLSLRSITSVLLLTVSLYFGASLSVAVMCSAALSCAWFILIDLRLPRASPQAFFNNKRTPTTALLWRALPLGAVAALVSLVAQLPRYAVEHFIGTAALGAYAALAYIPTMGTLPINAIGQAVSPRMAKHIADGDISAYFAKVRSLMGIALSFSLILVCISIALGESLIRVLYGSAYVEHAALLTPLAFAYAISYANSIIGYSLTAAKIYARQVPILAAAVAVGSIAQIVFVPRIGLNGAAWAYGLSMLTQLSFSGFVLWRWAQIQKEAIP